MTNFKIIIYCIASALILTGCNKILEPVSLLGGSQDVSSDKGQEEFEINIKSLTFDTAKKANNAPYSRRMILNGNGSRANVLDEAVFLKSKLPKPSNSPEYLLGIGDEISLTQLNEFQVESVRWPSASNESEYILGIGDELSFAQSNDTNIMESVPLIRTNGVIGSNGNILLFGLGNILAANRTLENLRTDVRNILIRNGLAPNFQLDISDFQSKKAYITKKNEINDIITLNNIPITLRELALVSGISPSYENLAMVILTRNNQEFRFTASQLFDLNAPEVTINDNDQIEIKILPNSATTIKSIIGTKGNILFGSVGNIPAVNRTLDDLNKEIRNILIKKDIKPNFQLELTNFNSKKAYLIQKGGGNKVIPLTSSAITLRELILENNISVLSNASLSIISLIRNDQVFRMTVNQILDPKTQDIWVMDRDQIEIEKLKYKPGQVFALSGAGRARVVPIDPSIRETLADILFAQNGALSNLLAKRSEVYLLRGKSPLDAYHLDAQNVSRILVAAKTELRPNDIVYVADRPIISFSRTLAEILPLRILLRDIENDQIP